MEVQAICLPNNVSVQPSKAKFEKIPFANMEHDHVGTKLTVATYVALCEGKYYNIFVIKSQLPVEYILGLIDSGELNFDKEPVDVTLRIDDIYSSCTCFEFLSSKENVVIIVKNPADTLGLDENNKYYRKLKYLDYIVFVPVFYG